MTPAVPQQGKESCMLAENDEGSSSAAPPPPPPLRFSSYSLLEVGGWMDYSKHVQS